MGYAGWSVVDAGSPAVHTGFGLGRFSAGGAMPAHVHSYEESLYVLDGQVVVQTAGEAVRLGPGDYGLIPVGVPHSLRNDTGSEVFFARMSAPTPRPEYDFDTFVVPELVETAPVAADVRDPRVRRYGHIDAAHMNPPLQTQDRLAVSASMRTALLVYSGITVKMMVDSDLGATQSTMFMVQYEPDGVAGAHDHPFEETYLIVEGTVEASFDGTRYTLEVGDVAWAGTGCVHGFRNVGSGPVRWLETQAPQPPGRHSYRFARDWDYLRQKLDSGGTA
jgi:quercetin dioxygenase-like cupin family protein